MKLGIHLSSYTGDWADCGFDYIPHAARTGYTAVEFPLMAPMDYDYRKAKKLLRQYNLSCTCGTGVNIAEDPSSPDTAIRERGRQRLKKCVDIANELEADCLGGVLYAPWGQRKPRSEAEENYKWAQESLENVAAYAKEKGVLLSLEILNRYESYFMNTVEEGIRFIEKIDADNVGIHFDTFHAFIEEEDLEKAIAYGKNHIFHVHLCDNNRAAPGTGGVSWEKVKKGLASISYERYAMVENFILPGTEAGNETCIWRNSRYDVYRNAELAYEFLEKLFHDIM